MEYFGLAPEGLRNLNTWAPLNAPYLKYIEAETK